MTNEPEWIESTVEKLKDKAVDIIFNREAGWSGKLEDAFREIIQDTIKEEKEKAKAELLSKIEEEVNKSQDIGRMLTTHEHWLNKEDVISTLSRHKVNK